MARSALPRARPMSHPRKRVDGGDLYLQRDDRPRRFGAACSFMNACQCTRKCTHTERLTSVHMLGAVMMMMMIVMMCTNGAYGQQHGSQKDLASLQSQHSAPSTSEPRVEAAPALLSVYACPMNWSSAAVVATAAGEAEMSARKCEFVHFAGTVLSNSSTQPPGVSDARQLVRFEHSNGDRLTVSSDVSLAYARANGYQEVAHEGWVYGSATAAGEGALPLLLYRTNSRWSGGANITAHWLMVGSQASIANGPVAMSGSDGWSQVSVEGWVALSWRSWHMRGAPSDAPPMPFAPSSLLAAVEFCDEAWVPPGTHADTWYISTIEPGVHFTSWTDGSACSPNGTCSHAAGWPAPGHMPDAGMSTGHAIVLGTHPSNLTLARIGTVAANAAPYEGRYPSGVLAFNNTLFYGTYALAVPANPNDQPGDGCGNWCVQGPWFGMRTSADGGGSWDEPRVSPRSFTDNIFGEEVVKQDPRPYPIGNDSSWVGKVKFGAPQVVDMGIGLQHSPDGKMYLIGHGAGPGEPQAWMQGSSVYMARCQPTKHAVNDIASWEFYAGSTSDGAPKWVSRDVGAAEPLLVWPNRTGVATMTYISALKKFVMVVGTPSHGLSMTGNFDTYFLESDSVTGPFRIIDYWREFGPQAYFVGIPAAFIADTVETDGTTRYVEVTLSYSANFRPSGWPSPAGSGGGWDLRRARLVLIDA